MLPHLLYTCNTTIQRHTIHQGFLWSFRKFVFFLSSPLPVKLGIHLCISALHNISWVGYASVQRYENCSPPVQRVLPEYISFPLYRPLKFIESEVCFPLHTFQLSWLQHKNELLISTASLVLSTHS